MLAYRPQPATIHDDAAHLRPVSSYRPPPPPASSAHLAPPRAAVSSSSRTKVPRQPSPPYRDAVQHQQPPAAAAAGPKTDKAKLTEQWGPPPDWIRRSSGSANGGDDEWLERGELLGEGGFARVYVSTEPDGTTRKALKVIAKEQLKSTKNKSKLFGEIKIHQAMQHPNIISFEHCFEDESNVYMQLELCANGTLLDLLRKRRRYSEPEARYYLVQLIGACVYMHKNSVIHRDLKLGNLMLDEGMNIRVGDFGLAALVKFPGERKKTICGTPNYIAPEILFDKTNGHSFEVDIWSIGVILYTLLVGKPPFQTKDVKDIYRNIKDNNYDFPASLPLSVEAVALIQAILHPSPSSRPTLAQILQHDFFVTGPFPPSIPTEAREGSACVEGWRNMTIRTAHRNFEAVKRECGISDEDMAVMQAEQVKAANEPAAGTVLDAVVEEEDAMPQPTLPAQNKMKKVVKDTAPTTRAGVDKVRGGMEKEVQQALAPDSPISELLRSARKPLMRSPPSQPTSASTTVTNASEPKEVLQRRLLAEARSSSSSSLAPAAPPKCSSRSDKENGSHSKTTTTVAAPPTATTHQRKAALSSSRVANAAPSSSAEPKKEVGTKPAPKGMKTVSEPISTRYPARELYDATWRALDAALSISTTAELDALPNSVTSSAPRVFITSWVDYTHKYGTAYSLTDGSAGLYFNDSTTMVLSPDKVHFDYISNRKGNVYSRRHYNVKQHPEDLTRKAYLLEYFEDYMAKTLTRDVPWQFVDVDRTKNMDFLVKYYRMKNAIVFKMSNEVLQFNFYDHTKLLITNHGSTLSFIDGDFKLKTYTLGGLFQEALRCGYYSRTGKTKDPAALEHVKFLINKVEYCRDVLQTLSTRKAAAAAAAAAAASATHAK